MGWLFTGGQNTYENPTKTFWTLDDLKKSISPSVGLEAHLDRFVVRGTVRVGDSDVHYEIEHKKEGLYDAGWLVRVTSDSPKAKEEVDKMVRGQLGGNDFPLGPKTYLKPAGKPSTSEIVDAVEKYNLGELKIAVRFSAVPKKKYKGAERANLKLQELKF